MFSGIGSHCRAGLYSRIFEQHKLDLIFFLKKTQNGELGREGEYDPNKLYNNLKELIF